MELALADDRPPVPPPDLLLRVSTSFDAQRIDAERMSFDLAGLDHLRGFERALGLVGRSLGDFERLLDFGCGCGRFIRHLGSLTERTEIHGTDIDAEMIEWCRANIPYGHYELAPHEPPLPYPDHHFDLVINHSVFTHLDERHQDLWLAELHRITRPGAMLLLTVEGTATWNRTRQASERIGEPTDRWSDELESRGILFIADDHFVGSTHPDFYHSAIHAPWYVFEHWTRFFDLAAYLPEGSDTQDLIMLKRRPDGAAQPRPIGHRGAEPAPAAPAAPAPPRRRRSLSAMALEQGRRIAQRRAPAPAESDPEAILRELSMLRAGLYEQGNRISVLAAEFRAGLDALRDGERPSD